MATTISAPGGLSKMGRTTTHEGMPIRLTEDINPRNWLGLKTGSTIPELDPCWSVRLGTAPFAV